MRKLLFATTTSLALALTGLSLASSLAPAAEKKPASTENVCPALKAEYPLNYDPAIDRLGLAALTSKADAGNLEAMTLLGLRYTTSPEGAALEKPLPDMAKAFALFQAAGNKGHGYGAYLTGVAYMNGAGVAKDEAAALSWFRRAAALGVPDAQFWVGELAAKGRAGLEPDWKTALTYFRSAADGGVAPAYIEIGYAYENGLGNLPTDYEKAAYCYRQILSRFQAAQYSLGRLIYEKLIVPQDGDPPPIPGLGVKVEK